MQDKFKGRMGMSEVLAGWKEGSGMGWCENSGEASGVNSDKGAPFLLR